VKRTETNLDNLVPTSGDNHGVHGVGGESNTRDPGELGKYEQIIHILHQQSSSPFGVTIFGDVELAFTQSVPQLDGSVSGSGDDLSVVSGEGDAKGRVDGLLVQDISITIDVIYSRQNITGVTDESSSGFTSVQVPQSQSLVPRSGQGELTVGRDDNVGDEVVVTVQDLLGVTVFAVFSGELPDDDLLVCSEMRESAQGTPELPPRLRRMVQRCLERVCDCHFSLSIHASSAYGLRFPPASTLYASRPAQNNRCSLLPSRPASFTNLGNQSRSCRGFRSR
jgi:hypothetical protein